MKKSRCINCSEYKNCQDSFTSWFFFIIGIIATVAIRVVTALMHLSPVYAKIAWYIGVGGFFLFFIYKFRVSQARYRTITKNELMDKMDTKRELTEIDYKLIGSILCALSSKKERVNYMFIFVLSAVALILAIYMDFIK